MRVVGPGTVSQISRSVPAPLTKALALVFASLLGIFPS